MPRYFFHTRDGRDHPDHEGVELANDAAARLYAVRYAGEVLISEPEALARGHKLDVQVVDERGEALFAIHSVVSGGLSS
ncbi:hypothetical protein GGQ88_002068 [Novosphingobium hassiacum]|uniref:DUF6894 domain-containing protein n=1 Tax=Novosphingobium hassiacum TaxID=173676 RepID=A0A7W5ZWZ2_9SPHN|nr:hypothetical protein [Novosphingobium hassiacum]MBB3860799.1 hypothetical protein [Novosphingobium hassiacum]